MAKAKSTKTQSVHPEADADLTQPVAPDNVQSDSAPTEKPHKSRKKKLVEEPALIEAKSEPLLEPQTKKPKRGGWIALGILGMLVIAFAGAAIGYSSAIKVRQTEETNQRLIVATTQFELSLQNIKDGNLDLAKRRLEYVIQVSPNYPGAADKLAEVLVDQAQANQGSNNSAASSLPVVVATKDTRGSAAIFAQAQQQLAAQDWQNLYISVSSLRDLDPTYEAIKVDGMYYLALRNVAIKNIQAGNLEIGIYQLSVAEQIGPIDGGTDPSVVSADAYRQWARMYVNAGSYWGVAGDWSKVVAGFSELYAIVPNLIDFNGITVKERYAQSLEGYGDDLQSIYDWCNAVTQYETSQSIMNIQTVSDKLPQARANCANPPPTPTPTPNPAWTPTPTTGH